MKTAAEHLHDIMNPWSQKRWSTYACKHGRQTDMWVSEEKFALIEAGVAAGTIEVRSIKDKCGLLWQYIEVSP